MRKRYPLSLLRVVSFVFGLAVFFSLSAEAGIVTDRFPLQMYAESQLDTYNNIGDARRAGWADGGTDLIRVTSINNGWLRVSHPGSGGRTVNRWCKANELFADPGYSNRGVNVKGAQTVYRTSTSGTKFGSVSNNESVIVLAEKNNRAQILYRLDNGTGYKAGWVPLSAVQEQENTGASATAYIPQGNFDTLASNGDHQIRVQGWALDRDDVNKQLEVHVYVGGGTGSGAECYSIRANKYRPDVNRAFPGVGDYHGFDETITVKRTGNQPVHVYAINIGGGRDNPELGHKTVAIRPLSATAYIPQGNFDTLASNSDHQIRVQGWALDRDDVTKQLEVHVYVGGGTGSGAESYAIRANKYRPDVNNAFPGVGDYHGFDETITVKRTGNQPVHVYAINIGGGKDNPELGHKTVAIRPFFQPYERDARQTVPAFMDAGLTQRNGNERVDAGDHVTVLKEEGNSLFVDYPAGNTRKQRWVDKKIFEEPSINTKIDDAMRYIASLEGRAMDYDGAYGAQCVDLIKYYYLKLRSCRNVVKSKIF